MTLISGYWSFFAVRQQQSTNKPFRKHKGLEKRIVSLLKGCVLIMQSVGLTSKQIKTMSDRWERKTWAASSPSAHIRLSFCSAALMDLDIFRADRGRGLALCVVFKHIKVLLSASLITFDYISTSNTSLWNVAVTSRGKKKKKKITTVSQLSSGHVWEHSRCNNDKLLIYRMSGPCFWSLPASSGPLCVTPITWGWVTDCFSEVIPEGRGRGSRHGFRKMDDWLTLIRGHLGQVTCNRGQ